MRVRGGGRLPHWITRPLIAETHRRKTHRRVRGGCSIAESRSSDPLRSRDTRGDASARRLSRRPPGPPLRRTGARDRRTRRARDLREQVVAELDAPLEERVQVLGEALVAQDAGAEVRRELAERVRKGLRISLRETRSALFCDAPCDSPCCGSARSSDPWRRSWLRWQYVWRRCVRTDELGLVEVGSFSVLLAKSIATARGARARAMPGR